MNCILHVIFIGRRVNCNTLDVMFASWRVKCIWDAMFIGVKGLTVPPWM